MADEPSYYETLGVSRDADGKAIKDAFRRLAIKHHPDRSKETGAEDRFKRIAEAYALLSDPEKRAQYDATGRAGVAGLSAEDPVAGVDLADIFGGHSFGGSIFERLFGGYRGGRARAHTGPDLEVSIVVPLERLAHGGTQEIRLHHPRTCPICAGVGAKPGTRPRRCEVCGGSGQLVETGRTARRLIQRIVECTSCAGRGQFIDDPCPKCAGRGRVDRTETLAVEIPIGAEEGAVLRVPGLGHPSPIPGGAPGDLFVVIGTQADPRFVRRGNDLWHTQVLEPPDLVLGTKIDVPTLEGEATVKIPPQTLPDTVLRLQGKGLPSSETGSRGDLNLVTKMKVPDDLTSEEIELYERLQHLAARRATAEHDIAGKADAKPEPDAKPPPDTAPKKDSVCEPDATPEPDAKPEPAKPTRRRWWWPWGSGRSG